MSGSVRSRATPRQQTAITSSRETRSENGRRAEPIGNHNPVGVKGQTGTSHQLPTGTPPPLHLHLHDSSRHVLVSSLKCKSKSECVCVGRTQTHDPSKKQHHDHVVVLDVYCQTQTNLLRLQTLRRLNLHSEKGKRQQAKTVR